MRKLGLVLGVGGLLIVVLLGLWIFSRPERGTTGFVLAARAERHTIRETDDGLALLHAFLTANSCQPPRVDVSPAST